MCHFELKWAWTCGHPYDAEGTLPELKNCSTFPDYEVLELPNGHLQPLEELTIDGKCKDCKKKRKTPKKREAPKNI